MEPDDISMDKALLGITVLGLIPIVGFAIWADLLSQDWKNKQIKNAEFKPQDELEKIRMGSLFVILFQFTLFLGSAEIQTAYPFLTQLSFATLLSLQLFLQFQTEKQLKHQDNPTEELFKLVARVGFSWLLGGLIYFGILIFSIKAAYLIGQKFHASSIWETTLLLSGGFFGVVIGFGLNFAFGPLYLRWMLPTLPLQDEQQLQQFENCFKKAGYLPPDIRTIQIKAFRISDILLTGWQKGRGPFRPALFIPSTLLLSLQKSELDALVANQVSHLALNHLTKRLLSSLILIIGTAFIAIATVFLSQEIFQASALTAILAPAVALISFLGSFRFLSIQAKKHEFEADVHSIHTLGVTLDTFSTALRKLDLPLIPGENLHSEGTLIGLPDTERRIERIRIHLENESSSSEDRKAA